MPDRALALWRQTLQNHASGLLVTLASVVGLGVALYRAGVAWLPLWLAAALSLTALRFMLYWRCRAVQARGGTDVRLRQAHSAGVLAAGLVWGALGWWGVPAFDGAQRFTILVVLSALAGGATATLAPLRIGGRLYAGLLLLPPCWQLFLLGDVGNVTLGVLGVIFTGVMISTHVSNHRLLCRAIDLSSDKEHLIGQLSEANSALEAKVELRTQSLREMAQHDLLTGLLNRRGLLAFDQTLAEQAGLMLCIFIDLDRFKHINDTHGHDFGDALLQATARRLRAGVARLEQQLQASGHALCRWGGDEFLLCLTGVQQEPAAFGAIIGGWHQTLSEPVAFAGLHMRVGHSVGYAHGVASQAQELLVWAELATTDAKRQGRGRAVAMTEQLLQLQQRRLRLLAKLASATADHSLAIAYQPIVAADNQRIVAMEALLRWQCAGLGPVSPAEFIPLAESADLVSGLGQWVLQQACAAAAQWRAAEGGAPPKLAVNTSIKQLVSPQYMDHVMRVLASSGLAPTRLVVEVTESVFDEGNMAQILSNLLALHNLGAEIHVDDFGTGYSSLSRLQELPLHAVKIDKSFVQSHDVQSRAVIEAAVLIAHRFGLRTIAEGVETEAQAAMLAQLGVDELQGYWFGKPDPRVPACFSALPCRLALAMPA